MYVCQFVCMFVCIHACKYIHINAMMVHNCIYIYTYINRHVYTHTYTYTDLCVCIHPYTHTQMCVCIHPDTYPLISFCIYMHAFIFHSISRCLTLTACSSLATVVNATCVSLCPQPHAGPRPRKATRICLPPVLGNWHMATLVPSSYGSSWGKQRQRSVLRLGLQEGGRRRRRYEEVCATTHRVLQELAVQISLRFNRGGLDAARSPGNHQGSTRERARELPSATNGGPTVLCVSTRVPEHPTRAGHDNNTSWDGILIWMTCSM